MEISTIKFQIKNISPATLATNNVIVPARANANGEKTYICPICGNGSGDSGDGLAVEKYSWGYNYRCFKCGQNFDSIKLLAIHYNLDTRAGFIEILKRAAADFGINFDFSDFNSYHDLQPFNFDESVLHKKSPEETAEEVKKTEEKAKLDKIIAFDIKLAQKQLKNLPLDDKGTWRGLTLDTLRHFDCGYIPDWTPPVTRLKGIKSTPTPRVIIPSANHYLARLIVPLDNFKNVHDFQYIKQKPHNGTKGVFGIDTISNKIVVSSPLAQVSQKKRAVKSFVCTVETDNEEPRTKNFPADLKTFALQKKIPYHGEISTSNLPYVYLVAIDGSKVTDKLKFFVVGANKINFNISEGGAFEVVVETFDGKVLKKCIPFAVNKINIEKIDSVQPAGTSTESDSRIVVETFSGNSKRFLPPPDVRKISLDFSLRADDGEELSDFLQYTLKIFETTCYQKVDDDEGDEIITGNEKILATENVCVFEGEVDAMTTWQVTHSENPTSAFIATGGASETNWVKIVDAHCKALNIKPYFIVMFDNDETGRKAAPLRVNELQQRGYPATYQFMGGENF